MTKVQFNLIKTESRIKSNRNFYIPAKEILTGVSDRWSCDLAERIFKLLNLLQYNFTIWNNRS